MSDYPNAVIEHVKEIYTDITTEEAIKKLDDAGPYGPFESASEFAQEYHDGVSGDLGLLSGYIDWKRVAEDMLINDFDEVKTGVLEYWYIPSYI